MKDNSCGPMFNLQSSILMPLNLNLIWLRIMVLPIATLKFERIVSQELKAK